MAMTVIPVRTDRRLGAFDIHDAIKGSLERQGISLQDGDILVVSSKFAAVSQGRTVRLDAVRTGGSGRRLASDYRMDKATAEIIWRESDDIHGGMAGFVMAETDGILAPNAGIDRSNADGGGAILYPNNPYRLAEEIKRKIFFESLAHVGVIISDSRLMPARVGTIGVAISCAGVEPVSDMRARKDLDGHPLKVTLGATADSIASAANHVMGEGAESVPIVVVRDSGARLTDRPVGAEVMTVSRDQCVYLRSMTGPAGRL